MNGARVGSSAATVHVARDGRVEERTVRLGLRTLEAAEVLDGLSAGDLVLLGPTPAPGRRLRVETAMTAATVTHRPAKASREDVGSALGNAMGR